MKEILIINNDLKAGGVQKALINLINEIHDQYHVTLLLFDNVGEFKGELPDDVCLQTVDSWFRYIGKSQASAICRTYQMDGTRQRGLSENGWFSVSQQLKRVR